MDRAGIFDSLGSVAATAHTAAVGGSVSSGAFLLNLLGIILINVVLSGDNSVVIAMAVHSLPPAKRTKGILIGTAGAVLLRVVFTLVASHLLEIPFLKLAGGATILWIAVKLLLEEAAITADGKKIDSIWHAVWIILVADLTMSLDNVLAVAGVSKGNVLELWLSLGLSIPLVVFASTMLSRLMGKYPIILVLGAALLGKVGGEMMYTDPAMTSWFKLESIWLKWCFEATCTLGVLFSAHWIRFRVAKGGHANDGAAEGVNPAEPDRDHPRP